MRFAPFIIQDNAERLPYTVIVLPSAAKAKVLGILPLYQSVPTVTVVSRLPLFIRTAVPAESALKSSFIAAPWATVRVIYLFIFCAIVETLIQSPTVRANNTTIFFISFECISIVKIT